MKKRIRELERLLGSKTLENEVLKEAVELARSKNDLARALVWLGQSMKTTAANALAVSRSNLARKPRALADDRERLSVSFVWLNSRLMLPKTLPNTVC